MINSLNKAILKIIHVSLSGNKTTCPEMGKPANSRRISGRRFSPGNTSAVRRLGNVACVANVLNLLYRVRGPAATQAKEMGRVKLVFDGTNFFYVIKFTSLSL